MERIKITEQISYCPATEEPLSADVGFIRCGEEWWIYDVGSSTEAAAAINGLQGRKNIVLSHFHPDHTGNIANLEYDTLYAGAYTCRSLKRGTAVEGHIYFEGGVHLFPLPSSHAKGCVGLEMGEYAFLGDGTYCTVKDGQVVHNAGLLRELILTLEALRARFVLQRHGNPFLCPKEEVLSSLREIYARRDRGNPYIQLESTKPKDPYSFLATAFSGS